MAGGGGRPAQGSQLVGDFGAAWVGFQGAGAGVACDDHVVGAKVLRDLARIVDGRLVGVLVWVEVTELGGGEGQDVVFAEVEVLGPARRGGVCAGVAVAASGAGTVVDPVGLHPPSARAAAQQAHQQVGAGAAVLGVGMALIAWAATKSSSLTSRVWAGCLEMTQSYAGFHRTTSRSPRLVTAGSA